MPKRFAAFAALQFNLPQIFSSTTELFVRMPGSFAQMAGFCLGLGEIYPGFTGQYLGLAEVFFGMAELLPGMAELFLRLAEVFAHMSELFVRKVRLAYSALKRRSKERRPNSKAPTYLQVTPGARPRVSPFLTTKTASCETKEHSASSRPKPAWFRGISILS